MSEIMARKFQNQVLKLTGLFLLAIFICGTVVYFSGTERKDSKFHNKGRPNCYLYFVSGDGSITSVHGVRDAAMISKFGRGGRRRNAK